METTNLEFRPSTIDESSKGYEPTNQQLLQQYEVRLQFLSRGCIVHVGCKSIAFESVESAMKELNYYVTNTCESQKAWNIVFDNQ
jgi:hypothetical protein